MGRPWGMKGSGHGVRWIVGETGRRSGRADCISRLYPGVGIKRRLQGRAGDAAGIIGDRRSGDNGDHLQKLVLAEARLKKRVGIGFRQLSTALDQCAGEL
jgi:hypothetical protein